MSGVELLLVSLAERLSLRQRLIALDTETTGTDPQVDRIAEQAMHGRFPSRQAVNA